MATKQTILYDLGFRTEINDSLRQWLLAVQNLAPFRVIDTTSGPYAEDTPPAGLNTATGRSNQNQEIIYKKISGDANAFTLNGTADGPFPEGPKVIAAQYDFFRIKSDGSSWYLVG